jgi:hypothetical protein
MVHSTGVDPMSLAIQDETMLIELDPKLRHFAAALQSDLNRWLGSRSLAKIKSGLKVDGSNMVFNTVAGPISFSSAALLADMSMEGVELTSDKQRRGESDSDTGLINFSDVILTPMLTQEAVLQGAMEHMTRAATLRNKEMIARLSADDAQRLGRFCAVPVLMYVLSKRCAQFGTQFIHDCLDTIDCFAPTTPADDFKIKLLNSAMNLDQEDGSAVQDLYVAADHDESRWWIRSYALMAWQNGTAGCTAESAAIDAAEAAAEQEVIATAVPTPVADLLDAACKAASMLQSGDVTPTKSGSSSSGNAASSVGDLFGEELLQTLQQKVADTAVHQRTIVSIKAGITEKEVAVSRLRQNGTGLRKLIGNLQLQLLATGAHFYLHPLNEPHSNLALTYSGHRGPVRVFRQKFTLEDAIGSHACSLQANMRVTNGIPLGCSLSYQLTL